MKIRSITTFVNLTEPIDSTLDAAARFTAAAKAAFGDAGYDVQTTRLATQPLPAVLGEADAETAVRLARRVDERGLADGLDYISLGTVPAHRGPDQLAFARLVPTVIGATERVDVTITIGDRRDGISLPAAQAAAVACLAIRDGTPGGFGNFRFAVLANCPPGIPFFPAAYHDGGAPAFALAWESADVVVDAFGAARSLIDAVDALRHAIEQTARPLETIADRLASAHGVRFLGSDISSAPFPRDDRSVGHALEQLGLRWFGAGGTLFAASLLTRALQTAQIRRCGYSGLMLPVLEDSTLARRAAEGTYTITSLLLDAAVCGLGLDCVPLPGDVSQDDLASLYLDIAALAVRLDKPLTARLFPVPGKAAGEWTDFDFPYFANSRILALPGPGSPDLFRRSDDRPLPG